MIFLHIEQNLNVNLNLIIENFYYSQSNIIILYESVSFMLSHINLETDGINIITSLSTVFPSPIQSPFETPKKIS